MYPDIRSQNVITVSFISKVRVTLYVVVKRRTNSPVVALSTTFRLSTHAIFIQRESTKAPITNRYHVLQSQLRDF